MVLADLAHDQTIEENVKGMQVLAVISNVTNPCLWKTRFEDCIFAPQICKCYSYLSSKEMNNNDGFYFDASRTHAPFTVVADEAEGIQMDCKSRIEQLAAILPKLQVIYKENSALVMLRQVLS